MQDDEHAWDNESDATIAGEAQHGIGRQHFTQVPSVDSPSAPIVGNERRRQYLYAGYSSVHYLFG